MTAKKEADLIEAVRERPVLYNKSYPDYRDSYVRMVAWNEISQEVNVEVLDCKYRWAKLRNRFTNALKRRTNKPNHDFVKWLHEDRMMFLLPYLDQRGGEDYAAVFGGTSQSVEDDGGTANQIPLRAVSESSDWNNVVDHDYDDYEENVIMLKDDFQNNDHNEPGPSQMSESGPILTLNKDFRKSVAKLDGVDLFYLSMAKVIKTLPKSEQAKLRIGVARIISEAEIEAEQNK